MLDALRNLYLEDPACGQQLGFSDFEELEGAILSGQINGQEILERLQPSVMDAEMLGQMGEHLIDDVDQLHQEDLDQIITGQ